MTNIGKEVLNELENSSILEVPERLEQATAAKRELIDRFIDKEYGGVFWSLTPLTVPQTPWTAGECLHESKTKS